MATLLLAAGGQALGGALGLGGLGGLLGKAAGALAGGVVDQALFGGSSRTVETGRLADLSVQSSSEGAALPKVYGRVRLAGQVIWATRFEEVISEEEQGGKGGGGSKVTVRSYSYFGNFAVGVCEGEIARIGRIWADGKLLDTRALQMRIYTGSGDQLPDPLLSALQETAPAYRGTAYVVFERLALEPFGNRLPQLSFEVIRPVEPLENQIRAVTIIPGAGEFAYAPQVVSEVLGPGQQRPLNRHVEAGSSDWTESMDELQALCPNLKRVALVVAWFGEDLRAEHCRIRPKVEDNLTQTSGGSWSVAGLNRQSAVPVSETDGRPSYGGTPSDSSVIAAIRDLKDRGLEVMLYPFVLMDIAPGNSLPGPDGGTGQPAFPWRGRIVAGPDAAQSISAFMGTVSASDFSTAPGSVAYAGPDEWTFRRHILHMAALAKAAGGVESLLIGTEMRGLTRAQAGNGVYPFVDALKALAAEVRALVGPDTKLSYAADWSEYGAHQVSADELRFPLDPLWADPSIDFIGIDNYLPLTDLRDGAVPETPDDLALYRDRIAAGEYFDWYYASDADRKAGVRTPITDGAYGKPWVYRAKDLEGFWQNEHFERVGGAELGSATAWQPASKPIRFTELGFPAVDRGTNQPNVFIDPKSSESMLPHFSRGGRDDALQRRALEAHLSWWSASHPVLPPGTNPVSPVYGAPMVDPDGIYLWTWDARPFPAFPTFKEVWADGDNWQRGHWLTGRLGGLSLSGLISALLADYGVPPGDITVSGRDGGVDG
ncbi:baseplate multidomain protein megatron [Roseibium denhamense]|uniref:baseplate multidomain protein megatron n=1 Tax=Roseibium denhamense TaxID=76305 RepID=UPI001AD8E9BD|nr:glycoside hydrolase TIM-barrel-like domain-containing protein [Roseibium denhamense]